MTEREKPDRSGSLFVGVIMIFIGAVLLLNQMDILDLDFGELISRFWPLILIAIGIKIILFPKDKRDEAKYAADPPPHAETTEEATLMDGDRLSISSVFGDVRQQIGSKEFSGGRCSAVFGDIDINAVGMGLKTGQRTLYLNGVFGDIRLTLPEDIPFLMRANTAAGDIDIRGVRGEGMFIHRSYKTDDFDGASTRLIIVASVLFGDIRVW